MTDDYFTVCEGITLDTVSFDRAMTSWFMESRGRNADVFAAYRVRFMGF